MMTPGLQLPQVTKHRFDQSERALRLLNRVFGPEAIVPLPGALQPASRRGAPGRPPSASEMVVQRLRAERLARGWTQKDLAARSGIERANIARLEAGKHSPRVDTLESLAKAMSLSLAELFETGQAAVEMRELSGRLIKSGVHRLQAELRRMKELGIIDERGRRRNRSLPAEMIKGTSEAV